MKNRGERMRKIIVFLLIAGIILGMTSVIENLDVENKISILYDIEGEEGDNSPIPCGGEGGGGGGGLPG